MNALVVVLTTAGAMLATYGVLALWWHRRLKRAAQVQAVRERLRARTAHFSATVQLDTNGMLAKFKSQGPLALGDYVTSADNGYVRSAILTMDPVIGVVVMCELELR